MRITWTRRHIDKDFKVGYGRNEYDEWILVEGENVRCGELPGVIDLGDSRRGCKFCTSREVAEMAFEECVKEHAKGR